MQLKKDDTPKTENLKLNDLENEIDEFDLSSISAKAMSREEIIAAAEAAAFAEEN